MQTKSGKHVQQINNNLHCTTSTLVTCLGNRNLSVEGSHIPNSLLTVLCSKPKFYQLQTGIS